MYLAKSPAPRLWPTATPSSGTGPTPSKCERRFAVERFCVFCPSAGLTCGGHPVPAGRSFCRSSGCGQRSDVEFITLSHLNMCLVWNGSAGSVRVKAAPLLPLPTALISR